MWFTLMYVSKQKLHLDSKYEKKINVNSRCKYSYLFEYWDNHAMVNLLKMGLLPNFQWFLSPFYISRQTLAATSGVHIHHGIKALPEILNRILSCSSSSMSIGHYFCRLLTYLIKVQFLLEINFKKISWIILAIT